MHYYKRHMGDYAKDTTDLSVTEHGVYTLLLDWQYSSEKALPTDKEKLYRLARATKKFEKWAVDAVFATFFPDGWNKRAVREMGEFAKKSDSCAKAVSLRWKQAVEKKAADGGEDTDVSTDVLRGGELPQSGRYTNQEPRTKNQEPSTPLTPQGEGEKAGEKPGPEEPPTIITEGMARGWIQTAAELGADYTQEETLNAWRDFHSTRFPNGQWRYNVTGRVAVADWRTALERQVQHNRTVMGRGDSPKKNGAALPPWKVRKAMEDELAEIRARVDYRYGLGMPLAQVDRNRMMELEGKLKALAVDAGV